MASQYEYRAIKTALESEIAALEEACNELGPDSHLRALCDVAAGRVRDLLLGIEPRGIQGAAPAAVTPTLHRTPIDRPHLTS